MSEISATLASDKQEGCSFFHGSAAAIALFTEEKLSITINSHLIHSTSLNWHNFSSQVRLSSPLIPVGVSAKLTCVFSSSCNFGMPLTCLCPFINVLHNFIAQLSTQFLIYWSFLVLKPRNFITLSNPI